MVAPRDSGHFGVVSAYVGSLPDRPDVPACPKCRSGKFVAALVDTKDSVTKGVCCENGHGWIPDDLIRIPIGEARQAERFASQATGRAIDLWIEEFGKELEGSSDRAAAILSGAMLDEVLALLARAKCVDDEVAEVRLFAAQRPLGTFVGKADFCFCLGLVSEAEWKALLIVAKIRNKFAHGLENLSFDDQALCAVTENIVESVRGGQQGGNGGRSLFDSGVGALWGSLVAKLSLVVRSANMPHDPTSPIHLRRVLGPDHS